MAKPLSNPWFKFNCVNLVSAPFVASIIFHYVTES
jgi:hypothetical protein